nr:hypothetical protein [Nonomuraea sp. SYSU D8015]
MRHDPQLKAVLSAYTLPIRRAAWSVDPAGCRDEVVQLVADDLGLPILGADNRPGPARRRGVRWADHLRLALQSLVYGFMPFERRYEIVNGQARLINLGERLPHTIGAINLRKDGTIDTVQQDVGTTQKIPADRLVWYVNEREGANWAGLSILRPAYGPWLIKHEMWRVNATSIRRFGMGVPSVEAPTSATPAQVLEAQRLASAIRVGDQSGVGLPPGFKLSLTGLTGSVPDVMAFVSYLDQQMAKQALAGLLDLGQTPNGSRALGDSLKDMFLLSLQAVAEEIAETATSGQPGMDGIVTQLVDYNWGEDEPAPRIVVADVGSRQEVTAEALDMLIRAGAITPDAELEAFVRNTWKLPQKEQRAPIAAPTPASPVHAAPRRRPRQKRAQAASEGGQRRQLTLLEAQAGIDPDAIHAVWENSLDRLLSDWQEISADWRSTLAERIAALVNAGDLTALAGIVLDTTAAAVLLAEAMVDVAREAIRQLVAEAASQGVDVDPPEPDEVGLTAIARAIAALLAGWLSGAAGREALRLAVPGADGEQVADGVTAHLESLSDVFLRDQLGAALSQAQASGRFAVLDVAPEAQYLASEVLDSGTCPSCLEIDGTAFDSLDEAKAAYANGGYISCQGRLRCRGIVAALWPEGV